MAHTALFTVPAAKANIKKNTHYRSDRGKLICTEIKSTTEKRVSPVRPDAEWGCVSMVTHTSLSRGPAHVPTAGQSLSCGLQKIFYEFMSVVCAVCPAFVSGFVQSSLEARVRPTKTCLFT